ncbi:hypothetical protein A3848_09825 [Paenibacillus sp. P32E]|nr:hypothetical protein A3848_09825 [Paenibacillus sp. P32E]
MKIRITSAPKGSWYESLVGRTVCEEFMYYTLNSARKKAWFCEGHSDKSVKAALGEGAKTDGTQL